MAVKALWLGARSRTWDPQSTQEELAVSLEATPERVATPARLRKAQSPERQIARSRPWAPQRIQEELATAETAATAAATAATAATAAAVMEGLVSAERSNTDHSL